MRHKDDLGPIIAVMRTFSGQVVVVADQKADLAAQQYSDDAGVIVPAERCGFTNACSFRYFVR